MKFSDTAKKRFILEKLVDLKDTLNNRFSRAEEMQKTARELKKVLSFYDKEYKVISATDSDEIDKVILKGCFESREDMMLNPTKLVSWTLQNKELVESIKKGKRDWVIAKEGKFIEEDDLPLSQIANFLLDNKYSFIKQNTGSKMEQTLGDLLKLEDIKHNLTSEYLQDTYGELERYLTKGEKEEFAKEVVQESADRLSGEFIGTPTYAKELAEIKAAYRKEKQEKEATNRQLAIYTINREWDFTDSATCYGWNYFDSIKQEAQKTEGEYDRQKGQQRS